ncbi:uncharacterized protein [Amphiura filiformis]|uniref:uncharacterized protein isoform X2 n=1 Tax=Amphiura filiformis TaxID=82378 RepID=UPI003B2240FC
MLSSMLLVCELCFTMLMAILGLPVHQSIAQKITDIDILNTNVTASIPLCPYAHQCAGCESSRGGCRCDNICQLFDDCCSLSCIAQATSVSDLDEHNIEHAQIGCVIPTLDESSGMTKSGFYMVDKCPELGVDLDLATKCHEPTKTDLQSMIPVSETKHGVSFRNVYCALCNAIPVENIILWKLQAQCNEEVLQDLQRGLAAGASLVTTLRVINEFCPITFGPPGKFVSTIGTRPCYPDLHDSADCFRDTRENVLNRCRGYTAYVVDDQDVIYRNPDCYICSNSIDKKYFETLLDCEHDNIPRIYQRSKFDGPGGGLPDPGLKPIGPGGPTDENPGLPGPGGPIDPMPPGRGPEIVPISVIVDFSSDSGVTVEIHDTVVTIDTVSCKDNEVYDPFADTCTLLSCPQGYTLIAGQCVFMPSGNDTECNGEFVVTVNATSYDCKDTVGDTAESECLNDIFHRLDLHVKNETSKCEENQFITYTFIINSTVSFADLETSFDMIFLPSDNDTFPKRSCRVNAFTLYLLCDSEPASCTKQVILSNVMIEKRNTSTIITNRNSEIVFTSGNLSLHYELNGNDTEFDKLVTAELCETANLSCSLVTLNASLFTNYSNEDILYEPTGDIFSREEYLYTMDGQIQVCSFFERNGTRNATRTITFVAYDTSQVILSVVGCIISMIALAITFLTYAMFASLRTPAAKAIMNLVAALFTAQMVFLLGAGYTENANACTFIAVLSHYLWLCTFTWSTVLSYDLNRTFSSKLIRSQQDKQARVYRYLLYGWLTPFGIILPCLVIHLCACSEIPFYYGNEGACWIYNQYSNLVVFGGPLLMCLIINCVFFATILWSIHSTKRRTRKLKQERSALENIKEELSIYVKIATLMGFTWIFAFSAAFTGVSALWYIYIIINSLQGLYIFFAFTCNARIARLWKDKIKGTRSDHTLTESSTTKSSNTIQNRANKNQENGVGQHELTYQTGNTTLHTEQSEQSSV